MGCLPCLQFYQYEIITLIGKQHLQLETLRGTESTLSKSTQRVLFYFISPPLNTSARKLQCRQRGVSSLRLSQHSGDPACSHQLWAQDSSLQSQTGGQPEAISAGQGTLQSPWHLPHTSYRQKTAAGAHCCEDLNADVKKNNIMLAEPYKDYKLHTLLAKPVGKTPAYPKTGLKRFLMSKAYIRQFTFFQKIQG